ncbi:3-deoxy-D-manno-octulosonic acid transferase [Curvibacter sp. APW13]|uniref:3-deoxy-D-manno-octulosonic acid transferase n=1 Tax=Curvibacter sp. APW13 TaxID=3077236 RepID=UPI0028DED281|nr:3-deoxy-D-manno-octulosonic acid transferase [Curvibacter sp. APW13]MDT8990966.1 3-deoxy-D-manno-octulosonic acid transferase [Curvibacter sp. APW13]
MLLRIYGWVMTLLIPLLRRKLARRALAEPGYGEAVEERFGGYTMAPLVGGKVVWVHAVSLGETRAVAALVQALRREIPAMRLLLTHGTATGREAGKALLQTGDVQVWQPWDCPLAVHRFVEQFRPRIGLLVETEVWPLLTAECKKQGVPLCLVNARLSDKSLRQAKRLGPLARQAYSSLAAVWAQSEADAQRLRQLGAPVAGVMGNFKFDLQPSAIQLGQGRAWRHVLGKPVVMLASAREGEEAMLADLLTRKEAQALVLTAQPASKTIAPAVQWLIVPRHPQRFDEVEALLRKAGLSVARRSQWPTVPGAPLPQADVWLGDSLGEMALYYGLSDVVLLGGSFAPLGGQNLIEAAACECPVVMGPHVFNFAQASELALEAGAAFTVADMAAGVQRALTLVDDATALATARQAALGLAMAHRGAADRTAVAVAKVLTTGGVVH